METAIQSFLVLTSCLVSTWWAREIDLCLVTLGVTAWMHTNYLSSASQETRNFSDWDIWDAIQRLSSIKYHAPRDPQLDQLQRLDSQSSWLWRLAIRRGADRLVDFNSNLICTYVHYNLCTRISPELGTRSLPDNFFPERKLPDEKYAIRLLPYRNVPHAKSRRYGRSQTRSFRDATIIRYVRDAKTPRYNKSHTRKLPDSIEIENTVECVEYKLEGRKIQFFF